MVTFRLRGGEGQLAALPPPGFSWASSPPPGVILGTSLVLPQGGDRALSAGSTAGSQTYWDRSAGAITDQVTGAMLQTCVGGSREWWQKS